MWIEFHLEKKKEIENNENAEIIRPKQIKDLKCQINAGNQKMINTLIYRQFNNKSLRKQMRLKTQQRYNALLLGMTINKGHLNVWREKKI